MGIGCVYPNRGAMATPANLVRFAHTAEVLGFERLSGNKGWRKKRFVR
jgi:hypothetical protein